MQGNNLKTLIAYGNKIYIRYSNEDEEEKTAQFRFGSQIPEGTICIVDGRIRRGGNIFSAATATLYLNFDDVQVYYKKSGKGMDPNSNYYYNDIPISKKAAKIADNSLATMRYYAEGGTDRWGYIYPEVYPFGL